MGSWSDSHPLSASILQGENSAEGSCLLSPLFPSAGPRECCVCGDVATLECSGCFKDKMFGPTGLKQFCSTCSKQVFGLFGHS